MSQIFPPAVLAYLATLELASVQAGPEHHLVIFENDGLLCEFARHVTSSRSPHLVIAEPEPVEALRSKMERRAEMLASGKSGIYFHCVPSDEADQWKANNPTIEIAREFIVE